MVKIKNKIIDGVYYDLKVGYYTLWSKRWSYKEFFSEFSIEVPFDEDQDFCVVIPEFPNYQNKVFSKGTLL